MHKMQTRFTFNCLKILSLIAIFLVQAGCVYRFTNLHLNTPENIRTIAVEAIYDSSKEILPHDILWHEVQRAIAADGHMIVTTPASADAILTVKIKNARFAPTGTVVKPQAITEDPPAISPDDGAIPSYKSFQTLTEAVEIMPSTSMVIEVHVELWHLEKKKLLFEKQYVQSETFLSVRPSTSPRNNFLRENEAFRSDFERMSRLISESLVNDLLVKS